MAAPRAWNLAYWGVVVVASTAAGGWLFVTVMQRPPDLASTVDELLLAAFIIPIVLVAWLFRVGLARVLRGR